MTERLYYQDSYLREFRARVVATTDGGRRVYLDRTAFYPASGGQPFDTGTLGGTNVIEVIDEEERIVHVLDSALNTALNAAKDTAVPPVEIAARIDWPRRFDHMQQHSGQHLLSAVFEELFHIPTLSFHMGAETSTIELGAPSLSPRQTEQVEELCAAVVRENRPVTITFIVPEHDSSADLGLRKATERTGTLRVVSIQDIDRSGCGGTHVATTSEIGPIFLRKTEKVRGHVRLEFVCGARALRHARADFRVLQDLSRQIALPAGEAPAWAAGQIARVAALEKNNRRLASELSGREGRELWAATAPGPDGIRRVSQSGAIDDATRTRAQAFCSQGRAVFLAISSDPPAVLLAAAPDSGIHAGERVKAALASAGGRGGGNAALAQGSLPAGADLELAARVLSLP